MLLPSLDVASLAVAFLGLVSEALPEDFLGAMATQGPGAGYAGYYSRDNLSGILLRGTGIPKQSCDKPCWTVGTIV